MTSGSWSDKSLLGVFWTLLVYAAHSCSVDSSYNFPNENHCSLVNFFISWGHVHWSKLSWLGQPVEHRSAHPHILIPLAYTRHCPSLLWQPQTQYCQQEKEFNSLFKNVGVSSSLSLQDQTSPKSQAGDTHKGSPYTLTKFHKDRSTTSPVTIHRWPIDLVWRCRPFTFLLFGAREGKGLVSLA